jgi:hypothetical protein
MQTEDGETQLAELTKDRFVIANVNGRDQRHAVVMTCATVRGAVRKAGSMCAGCTCSLQVVTRLQ